MLCNVEVWYQGSYLDPWINALTDTDTAPGRYVRSNYQNFINVNGSKRNFVVGPLVTGEGIYACQNGGTCISPDTCECADGFAGEDCSVPLCRHTAEGGVVRGCLNGGICGIKYGIACVC